MLLDRYLSRAVFAGALVALAALLGVGFFLTFLGQIHNIGTGAFSTTDALTYAALTMPQTAYDMFPIASLIGAIFVLGGLAANHELVLLRSAGAGMLRLARAVGWAGLALAFVAIALGEFVAPPAKQLAETLRARQMYAEISVAGPNGIWLKSDDQLVHVLRVQSPTDLESLRIYRLDGTGRVVSASSAARATYAQGAWTLHDLVGTRFGDSGTASFRAKERRWSNFVPPGTFGILVVDPGNLSWRGLLTYLQYLRVNGFASRSYQVAFWHKIAAPVSVLLMVLLALAFSAGFVRGGGAGQRLALGVVIGLAYYLLDRTVLEAGGAFAVPVLLAAWFPTALLAVVALFILRRVR